MNRLIIILLLSVVTVWASGPSSPANPKNITDINSVAELVVVGKPIKSTQHHFYKGSEVSETQVRELYTSYDPDSGEPFPRIETEFTVTLDTPTYLKGEPKNRELTFQWRDLTGSMCPHIPMEALNVKGIWYTEVQVEDGTRNNEVYWMNATAKKDFEEAIIKEAEQIAASIDEKASTQIYFIIVFIFILTVSTILIVKYFKTRKMKLIKLQNKSQ